jgi:glycosyltransferase involved in cell wall biosynthesis
MDRPLITFMIIAYNQERYVREAVEGAFSQTYSPLEILLSDDCSTDRTFEVMQRMAADYRGVHTVRLNRTEQNLGLGGHISQAMERAWGELIVVAASDDISLPQRTEQVWQAYAESDGKAMSIYSSFVMIDEHGHRQETVGEAPNETAYDIQAYIKAGRVHGCSHAWHRRVFDVFGPLYPGTVYEDKAIPFRSVLLGEIRFIEEPLVLYRRHSQSITGPQWRTPAGLDVVGDVVKRQKRRLLTLRNYERDLQCRHASIRIDAAIRDRLAASIHKRIRQFELEIAFNEGTFQDRVRVIRQGISAHVGPSRLAKWCVQLVYPYHLIRARRKLLADSAGKD